MNLSTTQHLWERVMRFVTMPKTPNGCWLWTGYRNPVSGYGQISLNARERDVLGTPQRTATAPWVVCTLSSGPGPEGLYVLHECENAPCCAPQHLRWGTAKENCRMAWESGRLVPRYGPRPPGQQRGEKHHQSKYSDALIASLRERVRAGETACSVAKELGIDVSYAYKLMKPKYAMRIEAP